MFNQTLRTVVVLLGAAFLGFCAPAAYAQSDRSDRPDSQDISTPRTDTTRDPAQEQRSAEEMSRRQTSKYSRALLTPGFLSIQTFSIDGGSADTYQEALDQAISGYETFLKKFSDTAYGRSHVKLRFEDFAPAYFIVLNPKVGSKFTDGMQLAEKMAQIRSYEKILKGDVGLDEATAERLGKEAKRVLKSFRK